MGQIILQVIVHSYVICLDDGTKEVISIYNTLVFNIQADDPQSLAEVQIAV